MRYLLDPTYRKYVQGYGFLSFGKNYADKYSKKLMDTAKKVGTSKYGKKKLIRQKKRK